MKQFTSLDDLELVALLQKGGGIGVLRTDTLYGVVARADSEQAVERVYRLKSRNDAKSPIVLIGSVDQLFDEPNDATRREMSAVWPGKVSIIVPSVKAPHWLTRGNESVAYRLPGSEALRQLLAQTGPLIAPSANPEGKSPAMTIDEAVIYFGNEVDFYVDGGRVDDETPSQLIRLADNGEMERLR